MNVKEYILSGIIESYVLGLASDEERMEFEQMCLQYPEVLQARIDFEKVLERQAMENAVAPSADLKEKIFEQINSSGKVVSIQPDTSKKINPIAAGWLKYAVAACIILLAGSLYWNISLYNKNKKLQSDFDDTIVKLNDVENDIRVLQQNPNVKMAALKGLDVSPQSYTTVYWDTASHDVYLLANNLPIPPSDKQYQLWALLDGKPIDLGMLDYDAKQKKLLVRMKNAQKAEAFAITLEKKNRPDVSTPQGDMYVMGKL